MSRYTDVKPVHNLLQKVLDRFPEVNIDIELYDKQHGATYIFKYYGKSIGRVYPLLKKGWFSFQFKVKKQTVTMPVSNDKEFSKVLLQLWYMLKKEEGKVLETISNIDEQEKEDNYEMSYMQSKYA